MTRVLDRGVSPVVEHTPAPSGWEKVQPGCSVQLVVADNTWDGGDGEPNPFASTERRDGVPRTCPCWLHTLGILKRH